MSISGSRRQRRVPAAPMSVAYGSNQWLSCDCQPFDDCQIARRLYLPRIRRTSGLLRWDVPQPLRRASFATSRSGQSGGLASSNVPEARACSTSGRLDAYTYGMEESDMRVLVADDDERLAAVVSRGLAEEGYAVDVAHDGEEAQYYAEINDYDLIVLDIMMPVQDGLSVCRTLRENGLKTPILMLTARDAVADRVAGLDTGADDYLVKPFAFDELVARVRALTRRQSPSRSAEMRAGDLCLDTVTRRLTRGGVEIALTAKEYAILEYMMRNPDVVVSRGMIEEHAWNNAFDSVSNLVDVYVRRLRSKIDSGEGSSMIETVRGAGYRLRVP